MLTYSVKLDPQPEGGFTATVPALPGCISEGETLKETLENIQDAISGYISALKKRKMPIPIESSEYYQVHFKSIRTPKKRREYA
jgi:predicted RNase H-like HicB family nuclease